MILLVGNNFTKFYSPYNNTVDSLRRVNPAEFTPQNVNIDGRTTIMPTQASLRMKLYSTASYQIAINTNETQCMDRIGIDKYTYSETLEKPVWKITADTSNILGYKCYKATTHYGGRGWVAWFTPEIVISEGPWKLRGLPGLILKASTIDNEFSFVATGLERPTSIFVKEDFTDYRKISKNDFFKEKHKYHTNPFAHFGIKIEATSTGNLPKINYNFIEKLE